MTHTTKTPCPKCHGEHLTDDNRLCDHPGCEGTGFLTLPVGDNSPVTEGTLGTLGCAPSTNLSERVLMGIIASLKLRLSALDRLADDVCSGPPIKERKELEDECT